MHSFARILMYRVGNKAIAITLLWNNIFIGISIPKYISKLYPPWKE